MGSRVRSSIFACPDPIGDAHREQSCENRVRPSSGASPTGKGKQGNSPQDQSFLGSPPSWAISRNPPCRRRWMGGIQTRRGAVRSPRVRGARFAGRDRKWSATYARQWRASAECGSISPMGRAELPGWAVDNRASVAREAAPYRNMTPAERSRALAAVCRAAARQLAARPDAQRMLDYRDPLPHDSELILERLRKIARHRAA